MHVLDISLNSGRFWQAIATTTLPSQQYHKYSCMFEKDRAAHTQNYTHGFQFLNSHCGEHDKEPLKMYPCQHCKPTWWMRDRPSQWVTINDLPTFNVHKAHCPMATPLKITTNGSVTLRGTTNIDCKQEPVRLCCTVWDCDPFRDFICHLMGSQESHRSRQIVDSSLGDIP